MLNPVHLRTLREVVGQESMAVAAHRLGYTASAVSQQMAALERACGVALFERTGRSVRPTPAGLLLAERAAEVLLGMEALVREVAEHAADGNRAMHLGAFPSGIRHLLPGVLARWGELRPTVTLHVVDGEPSQLIQMLVGEAALDVALVYRYETAGYVWPRGVEVHALGDDPLDVALPHDHPQAGAGAVLLADLAGDDWITHNSGVSGAVAFERACAGVGFAPRVRARSDDFAAILALVESGHGIALAPRSVLRRASGVAARPLAAPQVARGVLALTRRADDDVRLMVELLGDEFRRAIGATTPLAA